MPFLLLFVSVVVCRVIDPISIHPSQKRFSGTRSNQSYLLFQRCLGHHESNLFVYIVAAMSAGATSTTITNPLWVIKTRFMVMILQHIRAA